MKKFILVLLICMAGVGIPLTIAVFPPIYLVTIILGVVFFYSILLKIIKPIWIVAFVFICAPFVDVLRASYLKNIPFLGVYQEIVLFILLVSKIIASEEKTKVWRLGLLDYLIFLYVIWNLVQVIQSPSILGGLYVWRWYTIGPLTYLLFRLFSFTKHDYMVIITSISLGLVAASVFLFYQYFILGPETAATITQSLGFTAFYRNGWRLPGPFGSPLVASASYSILILLGIAMLSIKRLFIVGLCIVGIGAFAILITLSRSGVVIGLVGLLALLVVNFKMIKYKIIPAFLGIIIIFQFTYLIPETKQFVNFVTSGNIDSYDVERIEEFRSILSDAITKYPFGIGFGGGGAISQQAFQIFGGDSTFIPKHLGGDSVYFATLQTSGFLGFFLIVAINVIFIRSAFRLLTYELTVSQRILAMVSLSYFLGTFVTLGNLTDVWPLKFYLWSFGGIVMQLFTSFSSISEEPQSSSYSLKKNLTQWDSRINAYTRIDRQLS